MYAYADQNFFSACIDISRWRDALIRAREDGTAIVVLSPWHFYEIGNASPKLRAGMLGFAADIRPAWTFTMADLQLLEVFSEWKTFWGNPTAFQPIVTLPEVGAALHNIHPSYFERATLKDWIDAFSADDGKGIRNMLRFIGECHAKNQQSFKQGRLTTDILTRVNRMHVAIQLARAEQNGEAKDAMSRAEEILKQEPISTQIGFFVDFGGMANLKSYQVESALAENLWKSTAKFEARCVDRHHASVALPYCHRFITDDGDLITRCTAAKHSLKFSTALVQRGEDFIQSL